MNPDTTGMRPISLAGFFADAQGEIYNSQGIALVRRATPRGPVVRPKVGDKTYVLHVATEVYLAFNPSRADLFHREGLHARHADENHNNCAASNLHIGSSPQRWPTPPGFAIVKRYLGRYATDGAQVYDRDRGRFLSEHGGRVSLVNPDGVRYKARIAQLEVV